LSGVTARFSPELGDRGSQPEDVRAGEAGGVLACAGARGASAVAETPRLGERCIGAPRVRSAAGRRERKAFGAADRAPFRAWRPESGL
jgi:hypothetical protein